jgi:hypothetical protein
MKTNPTDVPVSTLSNGVDRYWLIDADLKPTQHTKRSYRNVPAAKEKAATTGLGVWDEQNHEWIEPVDFTRRIKSYEEEGERHRERHRELEQQHAARLRRCHELAAENGQPVERSTPWANSPEGMEAAHADGEHDGAPREGCPACEGR